MLLTWHFKKRTSFHVFSLLELAAMNCWNFFLFFLNWWILSPPSSSRYDLPLFSPDSIMDTLSERFTRTWGRLFSNMTFVLTCVDCRMLVRVATATVTREAVVSRRSRSSHSTQQWVILHRLRGRVVITCIQPDSCPKYISLDDHLPQPVSRYYWPPALLVHSNLINEQQPQLTFVANFPVCLHSLPQHSQVTCVANFPFCLHILPQHSQVTCVANSPVYLHIFPQHSQVTCLNSCLTMLKSHYWLTVLFFR